MHDVFKKLQELGIAQVTYQHEPLFTVEQALRIAATIPGTQCKNLFLKDSKGRVYLVVAVHDTAINLKKLSKTVAAPELRFASADLLRHYLGVEPGSVTPFGLVHDHEHAVTVILDAHLFTQQQVCFHPLINSATTVIAPVDLQKFIDACGNRHVTIDFAVMGS